MNVGHLPLKRLKNKMSKETQNTELSTDKSLHIADVSCRAIFKKVPSEYLSITGLFIGKLRVASYYIDYLSSIDDTKKYVVNSYVPSVILKTERFETEEECKQVCIKIAKLFCKQLTSISDISE